jgi:hypothetical protein
VFGTGQLMLLPDTRGEKENFYMKLAREQTARETAEQNKNNPPQPPYIPKLYHWSGEIYQFAMQYEGDKYFKELFKLWHKNYYPEFKDDEYESELVENAIETLENADRPVMLSSTLVWHKAIIDGANRYITERTFEVLDAVYEEYITLINLGISNRFTPEEEAEARNTTFYFKTFAEMILTGRELNGEPRNFDF